MQTQQLKDRLRMELASRLPDPGLSAMSRAAEKLRGLPAWRPAATVFATPGAGLQQVRINCLADGKRLVMPAPGLKEGYFLIPARSVPFKDLGHAVTYKGLQKFAQPLAFQELAGLGIDLLITDAIAVDPQGGRLGRGEGFFDLAAAILAEAGALAPQAEIIAVLSQDRLLSENLPQAPWDLRMTGAVTPEKLQRFSAAHGQPDRPRIYWEALPPERIRKIDPLFKMQRAGKGKGKGQ